MAQLDLTGKRVIAIGERDGVQSEAIVACALSAGATVVMQQTHCFV
jgi:glycine reductase